ncbi:unnamed protein product [Trichogramma brassicae]|uniref:MADF domain-containing protein n=1 Tax=Trichogramma brassicae TaxID=86971 RepID=A0A6H5J0F7_9HYME|nr:unnamed protein product [Trichogramma brassicae]
MRESCTQDLVQSTWNSLKSKYYRELAQSNCVSGSRLEDIFQSTWRREWKICLESERSSSVRAERDILGDVYVGLTSTARVVRSYVARVKSASAGTSRPECARENQWIQRPSRPQGQPRVDLDQEKISTSCGESGGPAFGRCICESYAPTRPPGRRSSRLPSTGPRFIIVAFARKMGICGFTAHTKTERRRDMRDVLAPATSIPKLCIGLCSMRKSSCT